MANFLGEEIEAEAADADQIGGSVTVVAEVTAAAARQNRTTDTRIAKPRDMFSSLREPGRQPSGMAKHLCAPRAAR